MLPTNVMTWLTMIIQVDDTDANKQSAAVHSQRLTCGDQDMVLSGLYPRWGTGISIKGDDPTMS